MKLTVRDKIIERARGTLEGENGGGRVCSLVCARVLENSSFALKEPMPDTQAFYSLDSCTFSLALALE